MYAVWIRNKSQGGDSMNRMTAVCMLVALALLAVTTDGTAQIYTPENVKNKQLILRQTINTNRKVYVSAGSDELYYIHDNSRLFPVRKSEPVIITAVAAKQGETEVAFKSEKLGKGKIRLYGASTPAHF